MARAAKYRQNAADCFAVAHLLADPHLRATMFRMAQSWFLLADHAEESSELDPSYRTPLGADDHVQ
jgi:hypothetical protein